MPARTGDYKKVGLCGPALRFWERSYAPDYLGLSLLLTAYILVQLLVEPFHRMFTLDNVSLQYPHASVERVSVLWLFIYSIGIPTGVLIVWALSFRPEGHKAHVTILGLYISLTLTSFLTDAVKNSVGRPRPDLISRCKPKEGTSEHILVNIEVCTEKGHHTLHDGWRSFPSGHSSFAFSGLGYLAIFLAGQFRVFRPGADLARFLIALAPILGAALIAISRLEDYRHDVYDVTAGSLLGLIVAFSTYRRYYPPLGAAGCDSPYPSRAVAVDARGFSKIKNGRVPGSDDDFALGDLDEDPEAMAMTTVRGARMNTDAA